jgi:hypothetical protein
VYSSRYDKLRVFSGTRCVVGRAQVVMWRKEYLESRSEKADTYRNPNGASVGAKG